MPTGGGEGRGRDEKVQVEGKKGADPPTMLLHNTEELDNDLGGGSDQDLSLSGLLGVVDGIERIVEDGGLNHFGGRRFSNRVIESEVSVGE